MWRSSVVVLLALSAPARADKAAADAAFAAAKQAMTAGKFAEACPKFELSLREDPQLGTQLNLADCHEKLGKLATAWAEFREAIDVAKQKKDDREAFAKERADKLAPRVSYITLKGAADRVVVTIDGADKTALIGVAIPIDPGEHTVTTKPGGSQTVKIDRDGMKIDVDVPIEREEVIVTSNGARKTRRIIALSVGGGGLVLAAVGLYFGNKSFSQYDDSRNHCEMNICDPAGLSLIDDAKSSALKANIFVGVGAAALVAGAVLWFTAPSERSSQTVTIRPVVTPAIAGGAVEVRF